MSPLLVDDGGKTWAVISGVGVISGVVLFLSTRDPLLSLATDLADGRPLVGTLLGWLPIGGFATYGGLVLAVRGRREARGLSVKRGLDRAMIALLTLWAGLAVSNAPYSRRGATDRWQEQITLPGAAFEAASSWCVWTVPLVALWALVPAVVLYRGRTGPPPRAAVRLAQAAIVAPPYVVLLVVLLVTSAA